MQGALPVLLTIEIIDYEKRGSAVHYNIEIMANNTKTWKLERRFKEIEEMHKKLARKINDIPFLPAKSIFQLFGEALDKRRDELEKYFNVLASRRDVLNDTDFKEFLEIDRHMKVDNLTLMKQLTEIQNFPRGVQDFIYIPQKGLLFILLTETSVVSKLGAMISNISSNKNKEEVSSVLLYKEDPLNSLEWTKVWKKSFNNEASSICVDLTTPFLTVGFASGQIICYKLEDDFSKHHEFCQVFCHNQAVKGMIVLPNSGYLISCSLDKSVIKTDVINDEGKMGEKVHSYALTCILADNSSRRFFVADVVGSIFIYSSEGELQLLHTITYSRENFVKTLCFDPLRNMLFSGSTQGIIVIYEIGRAGKEKFSTITGSFETLKNVRSVQFNPERKEMYIANSEGNVAIVNTLTTAAFHVNKAHANDLHKMIYLDGKKLMITAAGDKSIKFWRYPFDPKEKIIQKVIDQSGKVLSSTDPSQQYLIQKKQEEVKNNKNDDDEDDEEEDSEPRGPLTLLNYQPALEIDSEDEDNEREKNKPQVQKQVQKTQKPKETENKKNKKLFDDDDDDDNDNDEVFPRTVGKATKDANQASPKSFLFKNSLDSSASVKKTPEETKKPILNKKEEEKQNKPPIKKDPLQSSSNSDPLVLNKTDDKPKETKTPWTQKPKQPVEKSPLEQPKEIKEPPTLLPKQQDDDDKPLNFEELKKTSDYVPLTFKKKDDESEDEELSGWNS